MRLSCFLLYACVVRLHLRYQRFVLIHTAQLIHVLAGMFLVRLGLARMEWKSCRIYSALGETCCHQEQQQALGGLLQLPGSTALVRALRSAMHCWFSLDGCSRHAYLSMDGLLWFRSVVGCIGWWVSMLDASLVYET